ncbi:hypothetical protein [Nocardia sp. CA-119907]|uniref:hypothetical protein n=1 Tax=Nocardia sp. CA-119907 TaxID=3239973 RepID=UPI003D98BBEF
MNYAEVTQFDLHFSCEFNDQIRLISSTVPRIGVRRTRFRGGPSIPAPRGLEPTTRSVARWFDGDPALPGELSRHATHSGADAALVVSPQVVL